MSSESATGRTSRVLWLSNEMPDRHGQGGQRRQYFQIRELVRHGCDVHVITLATAQDRTSLREIATVERLVRWVRGRRVPFQWSRAERAARVGGRYDRVVLAHLESLELLGAGPLTPRDDLFVDLHNVKSDWSARIGNAHDARSYATLERVVLDVADTVSVCSDAELDRLPSSGQASRVVLRHGIDPDEWPDPAPSTAQAAPCVATFGNWGWLPNARGLAWFASEVWPEVRRRVPAARFLVAGSHVDPLVAATAGIDALGRVESLTDLAAAAVAVVVPVVDGVGASVKFAEALATGRPVLATHDGASAHPHSPAVVSDDPATWIAQLTKWLGGPEETHRLGQETRAYAMQCATWSHVCAPLVDWATRA